MLHLECCSSPRSVSETGIKEIRFFSHSFSNTMLYFCKLCKTGTTCFQIIYYKFFVLLKLNTLHFVWELPSNFVQFWHASTILFGILGAARGNPVKLDRSRKVWYLLLPVFGCCCQGLISGSAAALGCTQIWSFPNISLFPKILVVRQFVR